MNDKPKVHFSESFDFAQPEAEGGDLEVSGFSVHPGIYKGDLIEVPEEELSNIARTLMGSPFMKDHSYSVDDLVGLITETKVVFDENVGKNGVKYKGYVDDSKLSANINKGKIKNVSIGFEFTPICSVCNTDFRECEHWFDEAHIITKNCECYEQSFVVRGADSTTTVQPGAAFSDREGIMAQFTKKEKTPVPESGTQITDGENMDELQQVRDEFEAYKTQKAAELAAKDVEITSKDAEIANLTQINEEKDGIIETLNTQIEEKDETIQNFETDAATRAEEAKATFCKELAELEVSKGLTTKDALETRTEELKGKEMEVLDAIKATVEKIKGNGAKVGQFDGEQVPPVVDEAEIDYKDPEVRKAVFTSMFDNSKQ